MHVHILGIGGTFMGGLALLARELNFKVTGSDQAIYPPMSTQLQAMDIDLIEGYDENQLNPLPDCIVVGNVMKRGLPVIESLLNQGIPFLSGPEFLAEYILPKRHVLAVTGTHGKTTTSSMLAWILDVAGLSPGFLIGGVPFNFGISARLGRMPYFVLEADEYDSAFFDKRAKFIHSRAKTLIINNIEFDHADIYPNLAAIETQFHHLIRTIPNMGLIIHPSHDIAISRVLKMGCWTKASTFNDNAGFHAKLLNADGSRFEVLSGDVSHGIVEWSLLGNHNVSNALAAILAAEHVGVSKHFSTQALSRFSSVKRRLEIRGTVNNMTVYDDFAHHPTAIETTLAGLRAKVKNERILAVLEMRSNTMKAGHHQDLLPNSLHDATEVYFLKSKDIACDLDSVFEACGKKGGVFEDIELLLQSLQLSVKPHDHIVFMSNGAFGGIHRRMLSALENAAPAALPD